MSRPLMPKATAIWLVEHTTLAFDQIAGFCEMHELEVQAIADGEVAGGMAGVDPIAQGVLTRAEIDRCEKDPLARLKIAKRDLPQATSRSKGPRYTPVAKRGEKPDCVSWLLKSHPELSEPQIIRLIGTTKTTIAAIRDRSHWNATNIKPRSPVMLGLCTQMELDREVQKAGGVIGSASHVDEENDPPSAMSF